MLDLKSVQKKITKFVKIEKNQKTFIIELTSEKNKNFKKSRILAELLNKQSVADFVKYKIILKDSEENVSKEIV